MFIKINLRLSFGERLKESRKKNVSTILKIVVQFLKYLTLTLNHKKHKIIYQFSLLIHSIFYNKIQFKELFPVNNKTER